MEAGIRLRILETVINKICISFSIEEALGFIIQNIKENLPVKASSIIFTEENSKEFLIKNFRGLSGSYVKFLHGQKGHKFVADVLNQKTPCLITSKSPNYLKEGYDFEFDYKSLLGIPMHIKDKFLGVVILSSDNEGLFTDDVIKGLSSIINLASIIVERDEVIDQLRVQKNKDSLTGLYNYVYFHETLFREIKRSEMTGHTLGLLIGAIGHLKEFNSSYGHVLGDEAVVHLAKQVKESLRDIDIVCRYGNKIVIVMPEADKEIIKETIEKIVHLIKSKPYENKQPALTLSAGGVIFPAEAKDERSLIDKAEEKVLVAKRNGGSSFCI